MGGMEEAFPLAFAHHFGRSSDSRGQMSARTQRHTRGILSSTGSTIGPDLTQNNVPDDNMQIIDESQRPQTCTCPQGGGEGRLPQHSPACSHPSHGRFACWDCCSLPSAWLIPTCPSKLPPASPPQGQFLLSASQEAPSQPSPHSGIIILSFTTPCPRIQVSQLTSPPLTPQPGKTTGEKAWEPAALSPLKRWDLPPHPRSPYLPETTPRPG